MKQIRQGYSIGCAVQNLTAVCLTGAPAPSPGGGIGRRNGLKHRCPRGRVGPKIPSQDLETVITSPPLTEL